jgi:hypothetical protein
MLKFGIPLLALFACGGGPSNPALGTSSTTPGGAFDVAPPPGAGGLVLTGPSQTVSGELVTFVVTASDLAVGDRVELGTGTGLGAGHCPYQRQTGGSPCLDILGRVQPLVDAVAVDVGGSVSASASVRLTESVDQIHVQAFLFRGGSSATSNTVTLDVTQPWAELDPRVDTLEQSVMELQDAFSGLMQTPVKGELLAGDGSDWVAVEPGADGQALIADAAEPTGVRWADVNTTVEGTWTPTLSAASGAYGAITYASSVGGTYRKTGRSVHVLFTFGTESVSLGTASGQVIVGGLPFPVTDEVAVAGTSFSSALVGYQSGWVSPPYLLSLAAGGTEIYLRAASGPSGHTPLLVAGLGLGAGGNVMVGEMTYLTE